MAGKLKGVIPAQTPKGVRKDNVSISLAMFGIVSPNWRLVTLQQCSTTWSPRSTSPSASTKVLPCSCVMLFANSFCNSPVLPKNKLKLDLKFQIPLNLIYHIVPNNVLVSQHDLLPCENGCFGPCFVSCFGWFNSIFHLFLSCFGNFVNYLKISRKTSCRGC